MKLLSYTLFLSLFLMSVSVNGNDHAKGSVLPRSGSPEDAAVYLISPRDGQTVSQKFTVKFGLKGMGVSPAGLDQVNTGHHHLLINAEKLPAMDTIMGSNVMHFGGGQTETTLELPTGKHTLQLILGNYLHIPHNPPVISEKITINVE